jgi:exportin-7
MNQSYDITEIENYIVAAYQSQNPDERTKATTVISEFADRNNLGQNLALLSNTTNGLVIGFVCSNVKNMFMIHFNTFTPQERLDIQSTFYKFVGEVGPKVWHDTYVKSALCECVSTIQKLCLFDGEFNENAIVNNILPFLQSSANEHKIIGMNLMNSIVTAISVRAPSLSLIKQRKISTAFRESALIEILRLCFTTLENNLTYAGTGEQKNLIDSILTLMRAIFAFDFIGIEPDETADTSTTLHIPSSWAPLFDETKTLEIVFHVMKIMIYPEVIEKCFQIIGCFASIRVSLFKSPQIKKNWIGALIFGLTEVLKEGNSLVEARARHEFCFAISALKNNYQLVQIVECDGYAVFIQKLAEFTLIMFGTDDNNFNSIFYLIQFWARMTIAYKSIEEAGTPTFIPQICPKILQVFVETQIQRCILPTAEDPFDETHIFNILSEIHIISKVDYNAACTMLFNGLQNIANQFKSTVSGNSPEQLSNSEMQLSWMVYFTSSVALSMNKFLQDKQTTDAIVVELILIMFECLRFHDSRQNTTKSTASLEGAMLYFLHLFHRNYLADSINSIQKQLYESLGQRININSSAGVIEYSLKKIVDDLKKYRDNPLILSNILGEGLGEGLFWTVTLSISNSKFVKNAQFVSDLLENHNQIDLGSNSASDERTFYKAIGKLLFNFDKHFFFKFSYPWTMEMNNITAALVSGNPTSAEAGLNAFITILNKFRGLLMCISCKDQGYNFFFDWFYEDNQFFDVIVQLFGQNLGSLEHKKKCSLLRFVNEFAMNRGTRISFPVTSASGLLLFRSTAHILISYSNALKEVTNVPESAENDYFKSLQLFFQIFSTIMSGGYTNIAVFEIYNDNLVKELLNNVLVLIFSIDFNQLDKAPKLHGAVFQAISLIPMAELNFFMSLDASVFGKLMQILQKGLTGQSRLIIQLCVETLEKLLSRHISNMLLQQQGRNSVFLFEIEPMCLHIANNKALLSGLLLSLLSATVTIQGIHWIISKAVYSLIVILQEDFGNIKQLMVQSQTKYHNDVEATVRGERLAAALDGLMNNVVISLDESNKDKFNANLSTFRTEASEFIDLNSFSKAILESLQQ